MFLTHMQGESYPDQKSYQPQQEVSNVSTPSKAFYPPTKLTRENTQGN